jgi:ribosome-associated toxin RatA of RatAB toxin-antitoxin module
MPTVRKSVIVARPREALFALVDRVEAYPEFLPWCSGAEVLERGERHTRARLRIDYHGLESHIETRNENEPPERITLEFLDGPFREFHGAWTFAALGDAGCRVELALEYAFANRALEAMLGPVFGHIMETLVDRFVARAESGA